MNKISRIKLLIAAILVVFVLVVLAETLIVKVKTTNLKKEPVFYSNTIVVLNAGDQVEKTGEQQGWYKVRTAKGVEGWLHSSAVQKKKFSLLALDKSVASETSAKEVSLAGKGFNKQVETQYKANNPAVSFVVVDKMVKLRVSTKQLVDFIKKGKLGEFGGAK